MAVIGGVAAAVVAATGVGVYALVGADGPAGVLSAGPHKPKIKTGPPSAAEVTRTAKGFLDAWAAGHTRQAAALTDDAKTAGAVLAGFHDKARVTTLDLTPQHAAGAKVPFALAATVAYDHHTKQLAWNSALQVVRDKKTGDPLVHWQPTVLNPQLKAGQSIVTGDADIPPLHATDRDGHEITAQDHPALAGVLADLRKRYAGKAGGTPGVETRIVDAEGKDTGTTLATLSQGTAGTLKTTLDMTAQRAAEQAIAKKPKAAVVAIRPSTGEILAVAHTPAHGFDTALQGSYAPGSTMKVITSTLLMEKGLASPGAKHPCPKYFTYGHWKFHNDNDFEIKNGTFARSFAASCNTAFISQAPKLHDDSLTKEAHDVFGIGIPWQTGTKSFDGRVPVQHAAQMAASLIGQGGVRMNPMTMASVSATAREGAFKQPYIVSPSVDGRTLAKAPRTMSAETASKLRELMHITAVSGTAAKPMAGLGGEFGAKTGSAEVGGQDKPNAWFTAYHDDVAAAAVVPASGHGNENAGPVVRAIFDAMS
jgi:transpeptidase family protein